MAERIYLRGEDGGLEPLEEKPFTTEDELQVLLAKHPELLDGEQMQPDHPRRWVLISREMGIPEEQDESARWFVDHLLVDQDGIPTLVECKRSVNTATRRTIVGQLLEYAAHASESWTADKMRECFEAHCQARRLAPTAELADLLETDDADLDGFFQEVARNLDARRMRLLFVADEIPDSLLRVVEFLNQQMLDVEVLAVAIKQFVSKATETFVPRVLGRTAGASRYGPTGLRRKPNAVVKLVEARTLADGTQLKLKVEALPPGARDRVGAWIEKNPARGRATWQNDKQRPLKWAADGKSYSPTGLTQDILEEAAGQRPAIGGPRVWLVESSGESLLDLAASPSAADPLSDSLC